jgi:hypothetical protein
VTFKELARLNFRPLSDADRDVYADASDPEALIAYSHDQTWIIEGELLRVVRVNQNKTKATQQYFILEPWGEPVEVGEL